HRNFRRRQGRGKRLLLPRGYEVRSCRRLPDEEPLPRLEPLRVKAVLRLEEARRDPVTPRDAVERVARLDAVLHHAQRRELGEEGVALAHHARRGEELGVEVPRRETEAGGAV